MVIEISFPRGGRKPSLNLEKPIKPVKEHDLFGRKNIEKKPRPEKKVVKEKPEPLSKDIEASSAELINYKSIKDGMVLFGCIREVQKMAIGINLPGRLSGRVMVTQISNSYTELLHKIVDENEPEGYKSLRQIFTLGQCVAVKVMNINGMDEKYRIGLSMLPQDVNSQLSHPSIQAGMLLWGAISSVEEHGYVVDLGVNNCRAFLHKSNMDINKTYVQGEVGWFAVQKCDTTSNATTVVLNSMAHKLETMKVINDIKLDHLLPGMKVDLTISKRLDNGIEGKFLNDYTGYIHTSQMKTSFEKSRNLEVEQNIEARILYVMPITKLTYLTLRDMDTLHRGNIADGTLTTCTVTSSAKGGIYVLLGKSNNLKGFVSFRRLKKQIPLNGDLDDFAVLRRDYPKYSKHKCRVLSYDYLEQVYICSLEKHLTKNMIFSLNNLKVGQEVTAIIKEIQPAGFLVQIDNVQCYIKNLHISDVVVNSYANIKSKYKVGQSVKAKVWMINLKENNCQLTMKPSFMNADTILTSFEQATVNEQFLGIVKQISTNGLMIEFFGNVFGWVPKIEMSFEPVTRPDKMFKIGQVVKCTILKASSSRLSLSLQPPKITSKKKLLRLGQHVDAVVTDVTDAGIEVRIVHPNVPSIIPAMFVSEFPDIATTLAGMYKRGDTIKNLVCISTDDRRPVLSIRDAYLYQDNIPNLEDLEINTVLPCSIHSITDSVMFLRAPIKHFNRLVVVPSTNISNIGSLKSRDYKLNQFVLAKVSNITKDKKTKDDIVEATVKLNECWDFDLNESVERVHEYLKQIDKIKSNLKSLKNPLALLEIGELVNGVVQEKTNYGSYIVDLANGAKGIVHRDHIKGKIVVGSEVKGIVLWTDFINGFAELSLCAKLIPRINNIQDGKVSFPIGMERQNNIHAEVLLVKDDFALVVLRGKAGNRQVVFLPTRLHANDFFPDLRAFIVGDIIKIAITKVENGKIFGLLQQLIRDTNKSRPQLLTPMIQLPKSSNVENVTKHNNEIGETEQIQIDENSKKSKKRKNSETLHNDMTTEQTENVQLNKKSKKKKNSESLSSEETSEIDQADKRSENNETDKKSKNRKTSESSSEEITTNAEVNDKKSKKRKKSETLNNGTTTSEQTEDDQPNKKSKKKKNSEPLSSEETTEIDQTNKRSENNKTDKKSKNRKTSETSIEEITTNAEVNDKKSKKRKNSETLNNDMITTKQAENDQQNKKSKKKKNSESLLSEETTEINQTDKKSKNKKTSDTSSEEITTNAEDNDKKSKKRKKSETLEEPVEQKAEPKKKNKNKEKQNNEANETTEVPKIRKINAPTENTNPILSGATNFWNVPSLQNAEEESSGDEDPDQDLLTKQQKKKKLTPAERAEAARIEEERIRKIETELADSEAAPKTADQFDRLLLANPNNSLLWINYMAFHLEATEIEKARAIARKALNTIVFREEQEKLNVWIAFLNLENRYGSNDSFTTLLEEAVQMNDSLSVYLQALNILSDSKKTTEFQELLMKVSKKFKQDFKMWTGAAQACYKCDLKEQARNLMQRALKSLDEKQHVNLLVQFAFMESRYNEPERAEALLEKILASYPRRVDVWTSYVEMLIKSDRIQIARSVLERAAGQKLPARKMKTIFTKYIQFETKYGDEDKVNKVREIAAHYVKTALK